MRMMDALHNGFAVKVKVDVIPDRPNRVDPAEEVEKALKNRPTSFLE